ncbi:MAG: lysostaphin resistance A-like protein, partial [Microcystaceae cyanobacterium]
MTIKRLILLVLTIVALVPVFFSLGESLNQPQVQARLQLYQTNLILHASEVQLDSLEDKGNNTDFTSARNALIGDDPYATAQAQYQEARRVSQTNIDKLQAQLRQLSAEEITQSTQPIFPGMQAPDIAEQKQLQQAINEEKKFVDELDLKLGIIQAQQGETETALATWDALIARSQAEGFSAPILQTAAVLKGLWSKPPQGLANTESQLKNYLDGWFRYCALEQYYQVKNERDALLTLQQKEQEIALQTLFKLAIIGGIPILGGALGFLLLIVLLAQLLSKPAKSILASNSGVAWETPWDLEVIWQVLIVGFFFVGQILLPLLFSLSGFNPTGLSLRLKAVYVLVSYVLMAASGLLVLYFSIKPFFPLPKDWFRFNWLSNWFLWGFGGYLIALPLVVLVSLINQQFWQGQGGSNPLLFLALQAQDKAALAIFFFTASVAAPFFEELIFRGFLLASLTRYLPVWGAILISSLVFSFAHLSLSEVLPLATLGIVLGVVYTR